MVLGITDVQQHKQQEYYDVTLLHNFFIFLLGTGELVRGGNFGPIFGASQRSMSSSPKLHHRPKIDIIYIQPCAHSVS